jgi:hypothetical protein
VIVEYVVSEKLLKFSCFLLYNFNRRGFKTQFKFKGDNNKLEKDAKWSCNRFILNNNPRESHLAPIQSGSLTCASHRFTYSETYANMRNFGTWGRESYGAELPVEIGQVSAYNGALADYRSSFFVASLTSVVAFCWLLVLNSVGAGHSLEAVNVVGTGLVGAFGVALVTLLEVSHHLAAVGVAQVVRCVTKVGREEVGERRDSGSGGHVVGVLNWVWGLEEHGSLNLESLEIGMLELAGGENPSSFEGVSSNVSGMSVV